MHYQRDGLPTDVLEVFFSDRFYYAASVVRQRCGRGVGRALYVGSGASQESAIHDMRMQLAAGRKKNKHS